MPHKQKRSVHQPDLQAQPEGSGVVDAHVPVAEAVGATAASSSAVIPDTVQKILAAFGIPSVSGSLKKIYCSPTSIKAIPSKAKEGTSVQAEGSPSTAKPRVDAEQMRITLQKTLADLVEFLCDKYTKKEPVRKKEMLKYVTKELRSYFPLIFKTICECMDGVFGIEVKEIDSTSHSYMFLNIIDITYNEMGSRDQGLPKTGLLILVLCVIFMEGNRVPEEKVWEALSVIGVCPGKTSFIFGEPRKVITEDFVQEGYVMYKEVPYTYPPYCEFRWGPRAHAETSKMKLLKFFLRVKESTPWVFKHLYDEAVIDEEERIKLLVGTLKES
ncbi:putative MAGE domain-containing protein MAGEA13P [Perognathus longimembris pacificus]|uniref:putative MAGE domain-containing protein MAGEA13P n=1 Tax=Perognathus longimembris pacificus TaxID=214514 RepID=UPI002019D73C|nr:putative MAGE domain-containing protein MAGEA13P [Perognathus longimembris pacificus]